MPKPFDRFDYDDAANLIGSKVTLPRSGTRDFPLQLPSILESFIRPEMPVQRRTLTALRATEFYDGNHWQGATGFIGQLPPPGLERRIQILQDIKHGFVTENVIKEVTRTHVGGILGREPSWSFLPAEDDDRTSEEVRLVRKKFSKETGNTLTRWWNDRKALTDLQKAARILVCEGRVIRRVFFPRARLTDKGIGIASNLADALGLIYFATHPADEGGVFTNPDTMRDIGIFLFDEVNDDNEVVAHCAQLSFLDDSGGTVSKVVKDNGQVEEAGPYRLGGRLLIYEMTRDALITEQIQSNQRALNLAHTMMMRNVNMAGSRERYISNAQPPISSRKVDAEGKVTTTPGTLKTGAGASNLLTGLPIYGDDGKIKGYTSPNVNIAEPSPIEVFKQTIAEEKTAIYAQAHQRHVLIVDKADTSGRAREVARREYERSLKETKTELDACGRWQLETTLWLAAQIIGESSRYLGLRADFNCLIDAGDPDPEKQKAALLLRQPGGPKNQPLISDETARNWAGVEDAAAELARIEQESKLPEADLPEGLQPITGQQTPKVTSTSTIQ
jgi:hypothetical protein